MKKITLLLAICCLISFNLYSQTYKLETVFDENSTETYLSYWKVLEDSPSAAPDTFSLWGYQRYSESWKINAYEVEYFKGDANETFKFLKDINEFTEKYRDEDKVLTFIAGVQVKTLKKLGLKYTLVYDKERKVVCVYNQKKWMDIFNKFISFCETHGIDYNQPAKVEQVETVVTNDNNQSQLDSLQNTVVLSIASDHFKVSGFPDSVKLIMTNYTNGEITTGDHYFIEFFDGREWLKIPHFDKIAFHDIGYRLRNGDSKEFTIHFFTDKYRYKAGKYRIVKYYLKEDFRKTMIRNDVYASFYVV